LLGAELGVSRQLGPFLLRSRKLCGQVLGLDL